MSTASVVETPIPVVRGLPLVGSVAELARDPGALFVRAYLEHGPVFRVRALNRTLTVLAGPELARWRARGRARRVCGPGRCGRAWSTSTAPAAPC